MNYKKVTKPIARKYYDNGKEVYLLPCKVNAHIVFDSSYNGFIQPYVISKHGSDGSFDKVVNEFEYYNCNSKMGYYAHYYIKQKIIGGHANEIKLQKDG